MGHATLKIAKTLPQSAQNATFRLAYGSGRDAVFLCDQIRWMIEDRGTPKEFPGVPREFGTNLLQRAMEQRRCVIGFRRVVERNRIDDGLQVGLRGRAAGGRLLAFLTPMVFDDAAARDGPQPAAERRVRSTTVEPIESTKRGHKNFLRDIRRSVWRNIRRSAPAIQ